MKDDMENGERAEQATYEDERTSRRTVTISLSYVVQSTMLNLMLLGLHSFSYNMFS